MRLSGTSFKQPKNHQFALFYKGEAVTESAWWGNPSSDIIPESKSLVIMLHITRKVSSLKSFPTGDKLYSLSRFFSDATEPNFSNFNGTSTIYSSLDIGPSKPAKEGGWYILSKNGA